MWIVLGIWVVCFVFSILMLSMNRVFDPPTGRKVRWARILVSTFLFAPLVALLFVWRGGESGWRKGGGSPCWLRK